MVGCGGSPHPEMLVPKNLDHRLTNVKQILPTLATKGDLKAFATKEDLKAYPTREEVH
jgi:hypothetical protein